MPVNGESKLHFDSIDETITAFRESPKPPNMESTNLALLLLFCFLRSKVLVELSWTSGHRAEYVHWLIVHATGNGEFIVVLDSTDRENEGDLIIAAEDITTQKMAFMVKYTR